MHVLLIACLFSRILSRLIIVIVVVLITVVTIVIIVLMSINKGSNNSISNSTNNRNNILVLILAGHESDWQPRLVLDPIGYSEQHTHTPYK